MNSSVPKRASLQALMAGGVEASAPRAAAPARGEETETANEPPTSSAVCRQKWLADRHGHANRGRRAAADESSKSGSTAAVAAQAAGQQAAAEGNRPISTRRREADEPVKAASSHGRSRAVKVGRVQACAGAEIAQIATGVQN